MLLEHLYKRLNTKIMKRTFLFVISLLFVFTSCDPVEWLSESDEKWFFKNATDVVLKVSHTKMDLQTVAPGDSICILHKEKLEGNGVPVFDDFTPIDSIYVVTADGISVSQWVRSQADEYGRNIYSESEWKCHITEVNGPDDYSWTFSFANEDMNYYDPAKIVGKWTETYENYPDFIMDAAVYHSFKDNGAYGMDVYDSEGGVLKKEQQYIYSEGVITVHTFAGDDKYVITYLTDNEMEWQKIGTAFSEGTIGTNYKHFVRTDPNTQPYASHFIHDGYKVMYGEYEVSSVICFQEEMPEHLIEPATEKIQEGRLLQDGSKLTINQDMTYSLKESDVVVSSGRYEVGVYDVVPCEWLCCYYPGPCSFMGYLVLIDNNGDRRSFEMQVSAHDDKTKSYGIPWVYQYFEIEEGDFSYHYGVRYGLILL